MVNNFVSICSLNFIACLKPVLFHYLQAISHNIIHSCNNNFILQEVWPSQRYIFSFTCAFHQFELHACVCVHSFIWDYADFWQITAGKIVLCICRIFIHQIFIYKFMFGNNETSFNSLYTSTESMYFVVPSEYLQISICSRTRFVYIMIPLEA